MIDFGKFNELVKKGFQLFVDCKVWECFFVILYFTLKNLNLSYHLHEARIQFSIYCKTISRLILRGLKSSSNLFKLDYIDRSETVISN